MISLLLLSAGAIYISGKSGKMFFGLILFFLVAGAMVYEIRELYFYNLPGNTEVFNTELLAVLVLLLPVVLIRWKQRYVRPFRWIEISILFFLEYSGMLVMTRFLTIIPLLQTNVDSGRADVQAFSGVGIGWFLLVFPGSLLIVSIYNDSTPLLRKGVQLLLAYFPFILYGGRSLMVFPIMVVLFDRILNRNMGLSLTRSISIGVVAITLVLSFGVWREFGELSLNTESLAWMAADAATEYRSGVNVLHNLHAQRVPGFWQNLPAGLIPGFLWELFGENKTEYYHQIGTVVTSNSHYYKEFDGGMRLGLLGELAISNRTTRYIVLVTLLIMLFVVKYLRGYTSIIVYTCVLFSIPYGINFLMNGLQVIVYSYFLFGFLDVFGSNSIRR